MPLDEPRLLLESGFVVTDHAVARFDAAGGYAWVDQLRKLKRIPFPDRDRDTVLAHLLDCPSIPPIQVDEPLRFEQRRQPPKLGLRIVNKRDWNGDYFEARLLLDYGRGWMLDKGGGGIWVPDERLYVVRDSAAEAAAREVLKDLGLKPGTEGAWRLATKAMPRSVRELIQSGWHVEAEGKIFRRPGEAHVDVRSGVDWFELHGEVDYGGADGQAARAAGRPAPRREHGSAGRRHLRPAARGVAAPLRAAGRHWAQAGEDHLRFRRNQAGLLDALLAAQPEVPRRRTFARVRDELASFPRRISAPAARRLRWASLRDYQREGVGWMEFLRRFGFGGCLADDMGVGKTAQVLALLETRRAAAPGSTGPVAGGGPEVAGVQLEAGGGALHAAAARARPHRPGARRWSRLRALRPGADHLRHAAPRCRGVCKTSSSITSCSTKRRPSRTPPPSRPRRRACCAGSIAWRSAARRWRIIWASCGACSSS